MVIRRRVMLVLTMLAFFVSILEPVLQENVAQYRNSAPKVPIAGIANETFDLGPDQSFCRAFYNKNEKLDLEFLVNITPLNNRYTNIFQTDNLNRGLRLEIGPEGKLTASVYSPVGGGSEKVIRIQSNGAIKAKTSTKILLTVFSNKLALNIDDGPVAMQEGDFLPSCNHVLVGGGYDDTRTAIGDVQVTVRLQTSKIVTTFGLPMRARNIARMFFSIFLVTLLWEFRKRATT